MRDGEERRTAGYRPGKNGSKFFHCRDRLLSRRGNRVSGRYTFGQDFCAILAAKRRPFLRACSEPATAVVDLYSRSASGSHRS